MSGHLQENEARNGPGMWRSRYQAETEETMYQTTRQTGIATDAWAEDSPPNRTAMLQVVLVVSVT